MKISRQVHGAFALALLIPLGSCFSYQVPIDVVHRYQKIRNVEERELATRNELVVPAKNLSLANLALGHAHSYFSIYQSELPALILKDGKANSWATATPGGNIILQSSVTYIDDNGSNGQTVFTWHRLVATFCHELSHIHSEDWAREYLARSDRYVLKNGWSSSAARIALLGTAGALGGNLGETTFETMKDPAQYIKNYIGTQIASDLIIPFLKGEDSFDTDDAIGYRPFWAQRFPIELELQADVETVRCLHFLGIPKDVHYKLLVDAYSIYGGDAEGSAIRLSALKKMTYEDN